MLLKNIFPTLKNARRNIPFNIFRPCARERTQSSCIESFKEISTCLGSILQEPLSMLWIPGNLLAILRFRSREQYFLSYWLTSVNLRATRKEGMIKKSTELFESNFLKTFSNVNNLVSIKVPQNVFILLLFFERSTLLKLLL